MNAGDLLECIGPTLNFSGLRSTVDKLSFQFRFFNSNREKESLPISNGKLEVNLFDTTHEAHTRGTLSGQCRIEKLIKLRGLFYWGVYSDVEIVSLYTSPRLYLRNACTTSTLERKRDIMLGLSSRDNSSID